MAMRPAVTGGVVAALWLGALGTAAAAVGAVGIQLFTFRPASADVEAGTRVTWANHDDIEHTVTSGTPDARDGRFQGRFPGKGASVTVHFKEPGVYPYFCERHPSMRGEIRVY
jgi:plastocyanin